MPVISMFIGESTIAELKSVFIEELQSLFPELIKNYIEALKEDFNLDEIITEKIEKLEVERLENILKKGFGKQLNYLGIFSATIGFVIGLLQLLLVLITNN